MWRKWLYLFVIPIALGCGGPLAGLNSPDTLIVYSLDGRDPAPEGKRGQDVPAAIGEFHSYPILGQVEIKDPAQRKQIIAALKDGIAHGGPMAKCFWPRHGLRAIENGKTVEYVICFQCSRFEEFLAARKLRHEPIKADVQPTFDKPLQDAGIPIAPQ